MSEPVRLAVMGAGLIGRRHIEHVRARGEAILASIIDPQPAARELAQTWAPIECERLTYQADDPLGLQIANFCAVIRGVAEPVVSGREGLKTLKVIDAIKRAAKSGAIVSV